MNHYQFRVSVGTIGVTWNSASQLSRVDWYDNDCLAAAPEADGLPNGIPAPIEEIIRRLGAYFAVGKPIGEIPWELLDTRNWTEFQTRVYRALMQIPHGETRTYAWVAGRIGNLAAPRAVGQALRRNPLPILVPCHRVVSADALGGFMGISDPEQPELRLKSFLIENEYGYINPVFSFFSAAPAEAFGCG